jgi:hypothetical protein
MVLGHASCMFATCPTACDFASFQLLPPILGFTAHPIKQSFFPVHLCAGPAVATSRQIATVTGDRFLFRQFLKEWVFSFLFFFASSHYLAIFFLKINRIFLYIKNKIA